MIRKFSLFIVGAAIGAVSVVAVSQTAFHLSKPALAASSDTYRQLNLFGDVFERIRSDYVEEPAEAELIESAINGMLTSLDPHSSYLSPKNFRDMQVQTRGEFGGLGIEVTMENGYVKVVSPIDDTPAKRAGVLAGDLITHLDGENVQGLTLNEAVEMMRGPVKTAITITVRREGADGPIDIQIVRDRIEIKSVRSRKEEDIGYLRITQFNERTFETLKDSIAKLQQDIGEDNLKGYILDLRNNPGGLLDQAISVSDAFLDKGEIVSTRGRESRDTQRYNARSGDLTKGQPIIVLVNGGSASASEIVAGALQDHRRGTVLGTRSFGKGSVQTIIPLGKNGAIRLTTARYYTPSGRSIQAQGIDPDIEILQDLPEELQGRANSSGEAGLRGHLSSEGGEEKSGSQAYVPSDKKDDKQLLFAMSLLRGEKVDESFPPDPEKSVKN
ncbi:MAG: S41 family peptidase [Pseudomonadota bacterium]